MAKTLVRFCLMMVVVLALAAVPGPQTARAQGRVLRVKPGGSTSSSCGTWPNACSLQRALSLAVADDEVWVKAGVYKPTAGTDRTVSFNIPPGVAVYGGFDGTETAVDDRNPATHITILSGDIDNDDVDTDGNHIDETWVDIKNNNSYHVVTMDGTGTYDITSSTVLDGFTITGGLASASGGGLHCNGKASGSVCSPHLENVIFSGNRAVNGGAMFNDGSIGGTSSPSLKKVVLKGNYASGCGGGMHNYGYAGTSNPYVNDVTFSGNGGGSGGAICNQGSFGTTSPTLMNVTFTLNGASGNGGAVYNDGSSSGNSNPGLYNVTFDSNAAFLGGAIYNYGYTGTSSPTITNATFSWNHAVSAGGGIYNEGFNGTSSPTLTNVILWQDTAGTAVISEIYNSNAAPTVTYSVIQGGYAGTGNLSTDPKLGPLAANGGFTKTMVLLDGSPAIDAGTNSVCPASDQRFFSRPRDGDGDGTAICDIGATESRYVTTTFKSVGSQDGWILESGENTGIGGSVDATASTFNLGDDAARQQYRAILSFNTASLPGNATLKAVTLKFKKQGLVGSNPFATLGRILADVKKGAFSGSTALQAGDFQAASSKSGVLIFSNTLVSGWYSKALGSANFTYINTAGVTQFRLRFVTDDNNNAVADYLKLYSGNYGIAGDRPQLIIEYYAP